MNPLRSLLGALLAFFLVPLSLSAAPPNEQPKTLAEAQAIAATLKYRQGEILLHDNVARLTVPSDMRFLDGGDAQTVLSRLWGNPPDKDVLGLLVPANVTPLEAECWAVVITYEEGGHVKDDDAQKIDYDDLLKEMQKATGKANAERAKQGYAPISIVGWAEPPRYDRASHKLYWAKNIHFGDARENTLNYNIRVLGRKGVLVLNTVGTMSQLPQIDKKTPEILQAFDFTQGNRYADFNPAAGDKMAEYGIAALVAGGVAAKLGFFKGIWIALLAAKKFIIIGVAAVAAWFRKLFKKKETPGATATPEV